MKKCKQVPVTKAFIKENTHWIENHKGYEYLDYVTYLCSECLQLHLNGDVKGWFLVADPIKYEWLKKKEKVIIECTKRQYNNKDSALKAIRSLTYMGRSEKGVYQCKNCKKWHLTKQMNYNTPLTIKKYY